MCRRGLQQPFVRLLDGDDAVADFLQDVGHVLRPAASVPTHEGQMRHGLMEAEAAVVAAPAPAPLGRRGGCID
eukprot:1127311-Alexandrium_andersonii.AAC.1